MAYQPQSMYAARDFQAVPSTKLPSAGAYTGLQYEDDEESEKYFSEDEEEVPCYRRPEVLGTFCALASLGVIISLFVHSLNAGTQAVDSLTLPAPRPHPAPAPELPMRVVVTQATTAEPVVVLPPTTTTRNPLLPVEDRHDNNVCDTGEEYYAGLCYKRCALLTGNSHPIRTSSWTCCESEPCNLGNSKGSIGTTLVCNGYDVDGSGQHCPHEPGACLTNEEMLLGICYQKCDALTSGQFPHRVGPATCCMSEDLLGCLDMRKDKSSVAYNTGGGVGDHDQSTPGAAHPPLANLTESQNTPSTSFAPPTVAPGAGGHLPESDQCNPDEELYAGLCYKMCNLLTAGEYPIRTSTWTCCASHPCGLTNQKGSVGKAVVCNGFGIGGSGALQLTSQFPCPHKPAGCNANEEMLLGMCYTKCSSLTNGQFPYRSAAATCCKEKGLKACLDIRKTATSSVFNVGTIST